MIPEADFKQPLLTLLGEIFGAGDAPQGFILDSSADGLFGTLERISAAEASRAEPGHASIAAHTGHILFVLGFFAAYERGETPEPDWAGSWKTQTIDAPAWDALRAELRAAYDGVAARLRAREEWPSAGVGAGMMTLTHCAYHLGEIRQRLLWIATPGA